MPPRSRPGLRARSSLLTLLWLGLFLSAACLPVGSGPSSGGGGRGPGLLSQAETAYNRGQYPAAADHYRQYLAAEPNSPRLESILAAYGLAAEKSGRFEEAARAYERLAGQFPGGALAGEARFRLLPVYVALGEGGKAETLALQLRAAETGAARRAGLDLDLGRARWLAGRYREAAESFQAARAAGSGPVRTAAETGLLASLTRLDYAALTEIQQRAGHDFPGPEATYLLLRQTAAAGHREHAGAMADYFRSYFSASPLLPQVEAVAAALAASGAALPPLPFGADYDPRREAAAALAAAPTAAAGPSGSVGAGVPAGLTLAVLLPLSDKSGGQFALEVERGLRLAVDELAAGRLGLTVLDTGGSPDQAARLAAQAAADPLVLAAVGPMLSRESAAAAEAAERAGLPLIAVNHQLADLPRKGANVFRLFLTPRHQAEAVARYAVQTLNHQALGVIYPADSYGRSMKSYFQSEAARLGAAVTADDSYDPQTADFEALMQRLTGGRAARRVSTDYQAQVGFTALYLPDSPGSVAQLAPFLAFHDVTKILFLGSSLWIDRELLASSARYLQGAVIPAALSELSQRPESRRFIESFQRAYGHPPDQFAAYGYDAALAVIQALERGAGGRDALRRALSEGRPVPGATGPFCFDRQGEYLLEPTLLTITDRELTLLREPASKALSD